MDILGLVDIPLWLMLVIIFLLLLYVYGTWNHSTWASQGVPGPKPWPLLGNTMEVREKSGYHVFGGWHEKYGRVVGYYRGVQPMLTITDLDMVREVMVRQFNNFTERNRNRALKAPLIDKAVFFARGATWKRIRNLMTPAFTIIKLKLMSRYINRCSDLLVKNIESKAQAGELIDVKAVFQAFSLDVIAGTGFGLDTNSQTQEEEPFTRNARELFARAGFPGLTRFILYFIGENPGSKTCKRRAVDGGFKSDMLQGRGGCGRWVKVKFNSYQFDDFDANFGRNWVMSLCHIIIEGCLPERSISKGIKKADEQFCRQPSIIKM